jgi:crotonobetaine/carnitine-CoA ligase
MHLTDPAEVARQFQFRDENIGTLLKQWVDKHPDKVFFHWHPFVGEGRHWTYGQFWQDIRALAAGLQQNGIQAGDKVVVHSENCPEMLIAWYACSLIGAVAVTTNAGATATELAYYIKLVAPVAAITQPKFASLLLSYKDQLRWLAATATNNDGSGAGEADDAFLPFASLYEDPEALRPADCHALTPAGIVFTSGTTGLGKAVLHTHGNLLWAATIGPVNTGFTPNDMFLTYMPLFHVNAQMWATAITLGVGGSMVLLPKVTVSRFWSIAVKYGVSHMSMMPLIMQNVGDSIPEKHNLKYLGLGEFPEMNRIWRTRFHSIYGSSETVTHAVCTNVYRDCPAGVLGKTVPGYQAQVIDPESGEVCKSGETGELWVKGTRGIQMFLEYYNDPEATESAFEDGWFKTGDLIKVGTNGYMYFKHRLKDMIKVGGENVGVDEVESTILQLPEVREVAVVAKQDPALQEIPVAFIIPRKPMEQQDMEKLVLDHCREHLSAFKLPRLIRVVDDFPRSLLNKVAKNKLREIADEL